MGEKRYKLIIGHPYEGKDGLWQLDLELDGRVPRSKYHAVANAIENVLVDKTLFVWFRHKPGAPKWEARPAPGIRLKGLDAKLANILQNILPDWLDVVAWPPLPPGVIDPKVKEITAVGVPPPAASRPARGPAVVELWASAREMCGCEVCVPVHGVIKASRPCQVEIAFRALLERHDKSPGL